MVLICVSLVIRNVEHLFKCPFVIRMPSLEKDLLRLSANFLMLLFL